MRHLKIILLVLLILSCKGVTDNEQHEITIETDKYEYALNDSACVTFKNETNKNYYLEYCGYYPKYNIEKYVSGKWDVASGYTCDAGPWASKILKSGEIFTTKIAIRSFDIGNISVFNLFRFRFIISADNSAISYIDVSKSVSNTFRIK
jgi:hypothetical protein